MKGWQWALLGLGVAIALGGGFAATGSTSGVVQALANAIATAEGFFVAGSVPQRNNNPGDIEQGGQVISYPSASVGWQALYDQVSLMFNGGSAFYNPSMTIAQVAYSYADGANDPIGAQNWANNVAGQLGVSTGTTLQQLQTQFGG